MREDQTISVLLVEDEAAVRRSLAGKLRRDAARQYDIWEASHAEEAYEMIKRKQPHLILLDMRMPGMGGKQFLNILKEEFPSIKVIVLSGYSDFEFVQQALKCGASDYLLKPVINEELYEAVGRAVSEFISEKKRIHRGIQREMMLKLSLQMLKTSLLNSLLHKSYIRVEDVLGKLRYLNMEFRCRRYIAAVIRIADFAAIKEYYKSDASLIFFALENVMDESMTQIKSLFGFRNERVENEYVCIFGYDGDEAEMTAKLREDLARVLENVRKYNRMNLQIYLTGVFEQIADLHAAYRITSYAWKRKHADNAPGLFQFEQAARDAECDVPAEWTEADAKALADSLREGAVSNIAALVNRYFEPFGHLRVIPISVLEKLESGLFKSIEQFTTSVQSFSEDELPSSLRHFQQLIYHDPSPREMKYAVLKVLTDLAEWLSQDNRNGAKGVIMRVKAYIDSHYYEQLTLGELADRFFINRTYLSEKFKEVTGLPFKKYLNQVRIEKAKELLTEKGVKVDYIASLVGFNDPDYFSTVFKKLTGCTVKEYEMKMKH